MRLIATTSTSAGIQITLINSRRKPKSKLQVTYTKKLYTSTCLASSLSQRRKEEKWHSSQTNCSASSWMSVLETTWLSTTQGCCWKDQTYQRWKAITRREKTILFHSKNLILTSRSTNHRSATTGIQWETLNLIWTLWSGEVVPRLVWTIKGRSCMSVFKSSLPWLWG